MNRERWIDGFNVIHRLPELTALLGSEPEEARLRFLRMLASPASNSQERWFVIFDGPRAGRDFAPGPIEIVYAPSADRWSIDELRDHPDAGLITVVSSDEKDICRSARQLGAKVISADEFVATLLKRRRAKPQSEPGSDGGKPEHSSKKEIQYWLKRFSDSPPTEEDEEQDL